MSLAKHTVTVDRGFLSHPELKQETPGDKDIKELCKVELLVGAYSSQGVADRHAATELFNSLFPAAQYILHHRSP